MQEGGLNHISGHCTSAQRVGEARGTSKDHAATETSAAREGMIGGLRRSNIPAHRDTAATRLLVRPIRSCGCEITALLVLQGQGSRIWCHWCLTSVDRPSRQVRWRRRRSSLGETVHARRHAPATAAASGSSPSATPLLVDETSQLATRPPPRRSPRASPPPPLSTAATVDSSAGVDGVAGTSAGFIASPISWTVSTACSSIVSLGGSSTTAPATPSASSIARRLL